MGINGSTYRLLRNIAGHFQQGQMAVGVILGASLLRLGALRRSWRMSSSGAPISANVFWMAVEAAMAIAAPTCEIDADSTAA
jgi:hypothetical protein